MDLSNLQFIANQIIALMIHKIFWIEYDWWFVFGLICGLSLYMSYVFRGTVISFVSLIVMVVIIVFNNVIYYYSEYLSSLYLSAVYTIPDYHIHIFWSETIIMILILSVIEVKYRINRKLRRFVGIDKYDFNTRLTDINDIDKNLPKSKKYNPLKYLKLKRGIFFGLSNGKPLYLDIRKWLGSHIDISGHTGSGKGVLSAILIIQAMMRGEVVVIVDPKGDEYLIHIVKYFAKKLGIDSHYLDMESNFPQWNPAKDKTFHELVKLLSIVFGVVERNTESDYYRAMDRELIRKLAEISVNSGGDLVSIYNKSISLVDNPGTSKFLMDFREILSSRVCHANSGIDIKSVLANGGVIYVKGSTDNPIAVRLQKMFLMSVMQHAYNNYSDGSKHICMFIDELKYSVCQPVLHMLSLMRGKRFHAILAYQSMYDFRDCPPDVTSDGILANISTNCEIRVTYKINDPDIAEWYSKKSGDETAGQVSVRDASSDKTVVIQEIRKKLMDTNTLMSLPQFCAVLFGDGKAKFIVTSPVKIEKDPDDLRPTIYEDHDDQDSSLFSEDLINVD